MCGEFGFEDGDCAGAHQVEVAEVVVEVEADPVDALFDGPLCELGADVFGVSDDRVTEQGVVDRTGGVQAFLRRIRGTRRRWTPTCCVLPLGRRRRRSARPGPLLRWSSGR